MKLVSIKSGFTLAEVMVCLAILCVIASVAIPVINTKKIDNNRIKFKKAYSTVERVVYELVNDSELYPDKDLCAGLDNTDAGDGSLYNGVTKFRNLFKEKLNIASSSGTEVITNDGISYTIPNSNFSTPLTITIDVNGDLGPNVLDSDSGSCDHNVDRFEVYVEANGKISTDGVCAKEYKSEVNFN